MAGKSGGLVTKSVGLVTKCWKALDWEGRVLGVTLYPPSKFLLCDADWYSVRESMRWSSLL